MGRRNQVALTPKNKGGRPPRVPGEKLQRINLSLRPNVLFGLELLARDRDVSLSQAVEYAFNVVARSYDIEGETLDKISQSVAALEGGGLGEVTLDAHDGIEYTNEERKQILAKFFADTGLARILMTPASLRLAEERYFYDVYCVDGPHYWTEGEIFNRLARNGFVHGLSPEDVANEWRRLAKEKVAPRAATRKKAKKA